MRLLVISLLALFMSLMLVICGNSFLLTYIGVRLGASGIEPSQVGIVMVCYSIGFAAGSYWCTSLVRKVGHIRTFAALAALTAMTTISYPLFGYSLYFWAALRLIGGFSAAGLFVIIESWFSAVSSDDNRASLFSFYQVAAYSASAVAQLLVGVSEPLSPTPFTLAAMLLLAAIIPLSLSRMHSPETSESDRMSPLSLFRQAPLGITAAFIGGLLLGTYYGLVPLFGSLTHLSVKQVSLLMSASVLMAMLLAWPIGWICDRIQRSRVLLVVALIAALLSTGNALAVNLDFIPRLILAAITLGLMASIYSMAVALTNDIIDSSARVAASSALMLSYGLGSIVGPLLGSTLMELFNPGAFFSGLAVLLVALAIYTRYRQTQMPPLPVAAQEQFVATMPEGQVAPDFDPRTESEEDQPIEELFPDEMVEAYGDSEPAPEPWAVSEEIEAGEEMIGMPVYSTYRAEEESDSGEPINPETAENPAPADDDQASVSDSGHPNPPKSS